MRTQLLTNRVHRRLEQSVGPGLKYSSRCDVTWRSCDSGCQVRESPEARVCTAAQGCTSTLSTFRQSRRTRPWESSKVSDCVARCGCTRTLLMLTDWPGPEWPSTTRLRDRNSVCVGCTSAKLMVHRCYFRQNPGHSHTNPVVLWYKFTKIQKLKPDPQKKTIIQLL